MRIRNRPSAITSAPEGKPPKRVAPLITRWLYFGFLIFLAGYLIYAVIGRYINYSGTGYVQVNTVMISSQNGGRIIDQPVRELGEVKTGDLLAVIAPAKICDAEALARDDQRSQNLAFEIQLNRVRLKSLYDQLNLSSQRVDDDGIRRALEIDQDSARSRQKALRDTEEAKIHIIKLEREIELQKQRLRRHREQLKDRPAPQECMEQRIVSPVNGRVRKIHTHLYETLNSNAPIITLLPEQTEAYITAMFDQNTFNMLRSAPHVVVELPNGRTSDGVIQHVGGADKSLLANITGKEIAARIIPRNRAEQPLWIQFEGMEIKVKGSRL